MRRTPLAPFVVCAVLGLARLAHAGDTPLAESLFIEGRKLLEAGQFDQACPKLAESQRLDPGTGTLMTLALCNERWGHTATAWAQFSEALAASRQAGRKDRVAEAQKHVDALTPKLSKLRVVVPAAVSSLDGLEVVRDGVMLGPASWGTDAPVDPGEHRVEATARGKVRWSGVVSVAGNADRRELVVGPFVDVPPAPQVPVALPVTPVADAGPEPGAGRRVFGWIVAGVGVAAVGVGSGFGVYAINLGKDADARCPSSPCSDPVGVSTSSDAHAMANVANVAILGGAVALVTGVLLVLTAPRRASSSRIDLVVRF